MLWYYTTQHTSTYIPSGQTSNHETVHFTSHCHTVTLSYFAHWEILINKETSPPQTLSSVLLGLTRLGLPKISQNFKATEEKVLKGSFMCKPFYYHFSRFTCGFCEYIHSLLSTMNLLTLGHSTRSRSPMSQENWHPRKSGPPVQFFLGNLAPLQENWNPHKTIEYLAPPPKNPRIFGSTCQKF